MLSIILSVALLPLATRILHASDYGTYALLMSIVALVGTAMDGGGNLLLPARYGTALKLERGRIFGSVAAIAAIGATTIALLLVSFWIWRQGAFADRAITPLMVALTAIIIPMRAITGVSVTVFSVTGRSGVIAAQMAAQAVLVFAGTLTALFGFSMGGASLFIGAACGQFSALCVCLIVLWYHEELSPPSRRWLRGAVNSAPITGVSGLMDGARGFAENAMLVAVSGLHAAGIFGHARLYYNLLTAFGGTVAHNVLSRSLQDARESHSGFETTARAWAPVQVAIGYAGIVFVFLGRELVGVISNGRLTEAAIYIPAFAIIALFQVTEQPAAAIVSASGRAGSATWFRTVMVGAGLVLLYPAITFFGIAGILALGIVEAAVYRVYLRILASHEREVPYQDEIALFGCVLTGAAMAYERSAMPPLNDRLALAAAGIAFITLIGWRSLVRTIVTTWRLIVPRRSI